MYNLPSRFVVVDTLKHSTRDCLYFGYHAFIKVECLPVDRRVLTNACMLEARGLTVIVISQKLMKKW